MNRKKETIKEFMDKRAHSIILHFINHIPQECETVEIWAQTKFYRMEYIRIHNPNLKISLDNLIKYQHKIENEIRSLISNYVKNIDSSLFC